MTIVETVLVVSAVLNVIQLLLIFVLFTNFMSIKIQIQQMHTGLGVALNKLIGLEQVTSKMAASFTDFIKITEDLVDKSDDMRIGHLYRTSDGKYSAKSVDELIDKIKNDGNQSEYFSDEEINKLRSLFEEDDDEDDLDEEDNLH
jgi:hypothetical protein